MQSGVIWLQVMLYAMVVITMTAANIWAIVQQDVKRMLAYSSVSHAGFVMAAVLIGTTQANTALFLYWALFSFANLGAFTMLWVSRQKELLPGQSSDHPFEKFSGMFQTSPIQATLMGLFMLSLAGIPPFALFWGKLYLIGAAVSGGYTVLALIMALNSAVAGYYYLKLIVYMFMKEPVNGNRNYLVNASTSLKTIVGMAALVTIFSFIVVSPLIEFIGGFVFNSGY